MEIVNSSTYFMLSKSSPLICRALDLTAIASPDRQLAWLISTVDQARPI